MDGPILADILLVEDNPCDAELITRAIRKQGIAHSLFAVEDGAQALDFLFRRDASIDRNIPGLPKIVLLDLKMPKLDGLEVLKAIKTDERTREIPVVILTSSNEIGDIKKAYALGANSYVVKPVSSDAFNEAIRRLALYWLSVNQPPK